MKRIKIDDLVAKILIVFLLIQPIFDLKIFYNSISTLFRVIIIFLLFGYYFFREFLNRKKQGLKWNKLLGFTEYGLIIYALLLAVYFYFHHLNALKFNSLVPGNFNYSIVQEFLYFVKMVSPFLLIYSLYKSKLSFDTIIKIIKTLVLIISVIIVVTNLFLVSYGSYSDTIIKANFFEWFNPSSEYTYQDLASKGLFEYANQIGAILIMFLPFILCNTIKERKIFDLSLLILNIWSLLLLCTRVSVLGVIIVFIYTLIATVFMHILQKKKLKKIQFARYIPICAILLVYGLLLPFNPMFSRMQERATVIETFNNSTPSSIETDNNSMVNISKDITETPSKLPSAISQDNTMDYMTKYIEANYEDKKIHKQFLFDNYPYQYDTKFWYDFLQNDISLTSDYRYIELSMVKRVIEINNNKMDKWFGITNTRLQNIFNIEKDFVVQYYALRNFRNYTCFFTILYNASHVCISVFTFKIQKIEYT